MLLLVFLLWFAAEIAAFVVVSEQIGLLLALVLLVGVSALGPFIVRRVGTGVLAHTQERLARGELPSRELMDGFIVLAGGAMICVPGFVGDTVGLLLMIGPVRQMVIWTSGHRLARRVQTMRPTRWSYIDAGSRLSGGDDRSGPSRPPIERGGPGV